MIIRIQIHELRTGMYVHKLEVFWLKHPLVRNHMLITTQQQIDVIAESGIKEVWIDLEKGRGPDSQDPLHEQLALPRISGIHEEIAQAQAICLHAKGEVMSMFNDARLGKTIDTRSTLPLVDEIGGSLSRHPAALLSVVRLKTHDDYTYLHSVAVCALMVSLARQLNLNDEQTRLAGTAGLLHDVGKAGVSLEILNKPGKLTDDEFNVMKQHPVMGEDLLRRSGENEAVLDVALHHHEKINGSGYPHGLKGKDISQLARMAAICDVYDAVTSNRPYKAGWNPASAMHQMASWEGHFDRKIFYAFVKAVGIYPVGSIVRLASGRVAVVIEPGESSLLLPRVCVFYSLSANHMLRPEVIDLADRYCWDSIAGPEEADTWSHYNLNTLWMSPVA
ncbi:HD-GYP domain-containing protein [Erwinia sp. 198]|uniref:HD-GYP domain-containing protein n=1 Tax=Erwinia sp. 198 TaxID=2022746 RepID=UPI000F6590FC|nr:HD-GYP domain-containing protein [Erwinia sp. 198]RRZ95902.1 HD-GYP domain-containing protein [Erwinia sp. 198]